MAQNPARKGMREDKEKGMSGEESKMGEPGGEQGQGVLEEKRIRNVGQAQPKAGASGKVQNGRDPEPCRVWGGKGRGERNQGQH